MGLVTGDDDVIISTASGKAMRFHETQLRNQGRTTRGVKGITLKGEDVVVGIEVVTEGSSLLVATELGYGKRTDFAEYPRKNRGGQGVISIKTSERNGPVVAAFAVQDTDALMLITEKGQMVRTGLGELRNIGRNTQGVRLITLAEGDRLVSVSPVDAEEDDPESGDDAAPVLEGEGNSSDEPATREAESPAADEGGDAE